MIVIILLWSSHNTTDTTKYKAVLSVSALALMSRLFHSLQQYYIYIERYTLPTYT